MVHRANELARDVITGLQHDEDGTEDSDMDVDDGDNQEEPVVEAGNLKDSTIFLRAHTTRICALALKQDFEQAEEEIEVVTHATLNPVGEVDIELRRFRLVRDDVHRLQLILNGKEDPENKIDLIRWRLAHRWTS